MPMRNQRLTRFKRRLSLVMLSAMPMLLILAGCGMAQHQAPVHMSASQTDPAPKPLACTEFAPLTYSAGKPGATVQDVMDAMAKPPPNPSDPLAWVRGVVGDTMTTRIGVAAYAAARRRLACE